MTEPTAPTAAELVARARALQPLLREHAAKTDADRRVPTEVIEALGEAGLFKASLPKRYGGYATTLRAMLDVSAAVAEGDGSAGWVVALVNVCNWLAALFPERAQQEVFADGAPRVTGVLTPSATSRKVDGGWQVSGRWYFNSGSWWSTWAVLGVPLTSDGGEVIDQGLVLIPAADLAIEDVWYVTGMRGTASNCLVATDVFVPEHRVLSVPAAIEGSYPTPFTDEPLFRSAFIPLLTLVLAGPQLGLGRAALDLVIDKAAKKPITYTFFETQAESVAFQLQIADAATKIDVAALLSYRAAADIDDAAARGDYLDYPARARVRADTGYAVQSVIEALTILMNAHGASGFADTSPLQRIWRDSNTAARHAVVSPAIGYEVYGKALLGVEEKITPLV
jgi:alkylation response protein AidB-like acyl-CoA dehydrogenase